MGDTKQKAEVRSRKCYDCRATMRGSRTYYHYTEGGLDVMLEGIIVYRCPQCGAIVPEIPAIGALHRVMVRLIIQKRTLLAKEEIRFLRKMAGLSSKELAEALGADASTLSRWENGSRTISKKADAALRLLCLAGMLQEILRDRTIVPDVAEVTKQLSEVDIKNLLTRIADHATSPVSLSIDPRDLMGLGNQDEERPKTTVQ